MKHIFDNILRDTLMERLKALETHLGADVLVYSGTLMDGLENQFLTIIEDLVQYSTFPTNTPRKLFVFLTTNGGSPFAVERYVSILRHHYEEVHFIVPDYAYSAGTIFCMSGDSIYMDYFSVLGPIDPQVPNREGKYVPALGYLDKVSELLEKAANNTISQAEFIILKELDLAELRSYEQARDLTVDLLKHWLCKYKFKSWVAHKDGSPVLQAEKEERAEEIARKLSDNKRWMSHSRPIGVDVLVNELGLKINDYSNDFAFRSLIRSYNTLLMDYIRSFSPVVFIQTRHFLV